MFILKSGVCFGFIINVPCFVAHLLLAISFSIELYFLLVLLNITVVSLPLVPKKGGHRVPFWKILGV